MAELNRRQFFATVAAIICGPAIAKKLEAIKPYMSKWWPQPSSAGLTHLATHYYSKSGLNRLAKKFAFRRGSFSPDHYRSNT